MTTLQASPILSLANSCYSMANSITRNLVCTDHVDTRMVDVVTSFVEDFIVSV
jgi:hypothetical protein